MHDPINHPQHYKALAECAQCGAEVETIHVTERMNFNRGNAVKYAARAGRKGDARQEVEDLRKGAWYLTREADRLQALLDAKGRRQKLLDEAKAAQARRPYGPGGWTGTPPSPEPVDLPPEEKRRMDEPQKLMAKSGWSVKPPPDRLYKPLNGQRVTLTNRAAGTHLHGYQLDMPMPMSHARRTWLDRLLNR